MSSIVWLVQTADGGWSPGIGDPTPIGWFTVVAYFWAMLVCYRAWRLCSRRGRESRRLAWGWASLCALMAFLGLNKQLDLQTWLTVVGRQMAKDQGWYEQHRTVQVWFIAGLTLMAIGTGIVGSALMRRHLREFWLALVGGAFISLFVVVRAASFHHIDHLLGSSILGFRMNWILELTGIACVGLAARRFLRSQSRT